MFSVFLCCLFSLVHEVSTQWQELDFLISRDGFQISYEIVVNGPLVPPLLIIFSLFIMQYPFTFKFLVFSYVLMYLLVYTKKEHGHDFIKKGNLVLQSSFHGKVHSSDGLIERVCCRKLYLTFAWGWFHNLNLWSLSHLPTPSVVSRLLFLLGYDLISWIFLMASLIKYSRTFLWSWKL